MIKFIGKVSHFLFFACLFFLMLMIAWDLFAGVFFDLNSDTRKLGDSHIYRYGMLSIPGSLVFALLAQYCGRDLSDWNQWEEFDPRNR